MSTTTPNPRFSKRTNDVLAFALAADNPVTTEEIATHFNMLSTTTSTYLSRLVDAGYLTRLYRGVYQPIERQEVNR